MTPTPAQLDVLRVVAGADPERGYALRRLPLATADACIARGWLTEWVSWPGVDCPPLMHRVGLTPAGRCALGEDRLRFPGEVSTCPAAASNWRGRYPHTRRTKERP